MADMSAHYYDWKAIDAERAIRAMASGAKVLKLPTSFCKAGGAATYSHGIQTIRGTCYLVSDRVMKAAEIPAVN